MVQGTWLRRSILCVLGLAICFGSVAWAAADSGDSRCAASPAEAAAKMGMEIVGDGVAVYRGVRLVQSAADPLLWLVPGAESSGAPGVVFASSSECGRFGGVQFEFCCDDKYVGSAIIVPDPEGNAQAVPTTATCSSGGSCTYNEAGPCQ